MSHTRNDGLQVFGNSNCWGYHTKNSGRNNNIHNYLAYNRKFFLLLGVINVLKVLFSESWNNRKFIPPTLINTGGVQCIRIVKPKEV